MTSVVASDGEIQRIQSGPYQELFPDGVEVDPENWVLALDVQKSSMAFRVLVPGSEDLYAEASPTLHYEKRSDLTFLLWEGFLNRIHPVLHLATFNGARWIDEVEIFGGSFTDKQDPQLVIRSYDSDSLKRTVSAKGSRRTAFFVVWSEDLGTVNRKRMIPLILQNGTYSGLNTHLFLSDFLDGQTGAPVAVDPNIRQALRIQPSPEGVTIGFTNETSKEIVTLGAELLPSELSSLSQMVGDVVQTYALASEEYVVHLVRTLIFQEGDAFNAGSLNHLADEVEGIIRAELGQGLPNLPALPDIARAHVILVGARFEPHGLAGPGDPAIVEIRPPENPDVAHHVKVSRISRRPAPEVGGDVSIFLSRDGFDVLVAWQGEGFVHFRESEGEGWSGVQEIEQTESLNADAVYELLAERVLNR